ncbi:MAG TPA: cytochrome c peroxidase [Chryseosolibacter sp.]
MKISRTLSLFAGLAFVAIACTTEESPIQTLTLDLPATPDTYITGSHVPTLGRVLFYDRKLSLNNSVSCATCHKQNLAFADNVAFSEGFERKLTSRNSMPIQNISTTFRDSLVIDPIFPGFLPTQLFWDGREHDLKTMVMKPIVNHVEMGFSDLSQLEEKLSRVEYYGPLFEKAFGDRIITEERIATAISSFVQSITSQDTKFNNAMVGKTTLSALEKTGRELFTSTYDCNSCHQIESPHGYIMAGTFANIGLDLAYQDNGLGEVTKNASDNGKFKIPSLRNVALTAPYMHDGRFKTLDEVMEHYSRGIEDHPNLDPRLKTAMGDARVMEIPASDKKAIIAFLHTLTDHKMITDPKFSDPFKVQ